MRAMSTGAGDPHVAVGAPANADAGNVLHATSKASTSLPAATNRWHDFPNAVSARTPPVRLDRSKYLDKGVYRRICSRGLIIYIHVEDFEGDHLSENLSAQLRGLPADEVFISGGSAYLLDNEIVHDSGSRRFTHGWSVIIMHSPSDCEHRVASSSRCPDSIKVYSMQLRCCMPASRCRPRLIRPVCQRHAAMTAC